MGYYLQPRGHDIDRVDGARSKEKGHDNRLADAHHPLPGLEERSQKDGQAGKTHAGERDNDEYPDDTKWG